MTKATNLTSIKCGVTHFVANINIDESEYFYLYAATLKTTEKAVSADEKFQLATIFNDKLMIVVLLIKLIALRNTSYKNRQNKCKFSPK